MLQTEKDLLLDVLVIEFYGVTRLKKLEGFMMDTLAGCAKKEVF